MLDVRAFLCFNLPMGKGLIFDVDGVIADTEAVNARASIRVFEELFGVKGVQRRDFESGLGRGAEAYMLAAADVNGIALDPQQIAAAVRVRQDYFLEELQRDPLPPFPGVTELMDEAVASPDWEVAIATSSTREKSGAVLRAARIPYRQMVYVTGSDVTARKPDPELFLTAAGRMGVEACRCVVIEDAPDGVAAADAAACKCIAVTNSTTPERLAQEDRIVGRLAEVHLADCALLLR
ncbi:MAG: HAD family phosphatase [Lentisphaerae bacterium]|nr:HAD family phosphatase [Lentisphaerota bacterium]